MEATTKLIQPVPVQRDEMGHWNHPDMPVFEGSDEAEPGAPKWKDWLLEQDLEVCRFDLEDEHEDHPTYQRYYGDDPDADIAAWNPKPDGDGWFLLAIGDTDDGPMAWFARRIESVPHPQGADTKEKGN